MKTQYIIIGGLAVAGLGVAAYLYTRKEDSPSQQTSLTPSETAAQIFDQIQPGSIQEKIATRPAVVVKLPGTVTPKTETTTSVKVTPEKTTLPKATAPVLTKVTQGSQQVSPSPTPVKTTAVVPTKIVNEAPTTKVFPPVSTTVLKEASTNKLLFKTSLSLDGAANFLS